jgi:hypothetical protein
VVWTNYFLSTYKVTVSYNCWPRGLIAMRGLYACVALLASFIDSSSYKGEVCSLSLRFTLASSHHLYPLLRAIRF